MRKELIPELSNKPVRVCDSCFNTVTQRRLSGVLPAVPPTPTATLVKPPEVVVVQANEPAYDTIVRRVDQPSNGFNVKEVNGAETSESDDDEYNESSDGLTQAAHALSLEDQKPTFYSEVMEATDELLETSKVEEGETTPRKTDEKPSNGTNAFPSVPEAVTSESSN